MERLVFPRHSLSPRDFFGSVWHVRGTKRMQGYQDAKIVRLVVHWLECDWADGPGMRGVREN
jgi:hypothetical protein